MLLEKVKDLCSSENDLSFYVYDLDALVERISQFKALFSESFHIHFAVKSNFHPRFLSTIKSLGLKADVVSWGEASRALESGFKASEIIFSGIGKTKDEIEMALKSDIYQINVESLPELKRISEIAKKLNKTARIALRVNPNVNAETHPYIRTGLLENKFGIEFDVAEEILASADDDLPHVQICGLTMHIGSQILDTAPFVEAADKVLSLYLKYQKKISTLESIDLGGGLGLNYEATSDSNKEDMDRAKLYSEALIKLVQPALKSGQLKSVILEPGRFLAARSGYLLTQIQYVKKTAVKKFVIVDTGMHHLMRPCLYQAYHSIQSFEQFAGKSIETQDCDIVGPICESSDNLGKKRPLPKDIEAGEWLIVRDVGAYGSVMASNYNLRPPAPEYFIKDGTIS